MSVDLPYTFTTTSGDGRFSALDIIKDAYHRCGFISEDESLTAEQTARGLSLLNHMMFGWEAQGIEYQHAALALNDMVNVPDTMVRATALMLMDEVAAEYGKTLSDRQMQAVEGARGGLQSFYTKVPQAQTDEGIRNRRLYSGTITTSTPL